MSRSSKQPLRTPTEKNASPRRELGRDNPSRATKPRNYGNTAKTPTLFDMVDADYKAAAKQARRQYDTAHRTLYLIIQAAFRFAERLSGDSKLWDDFEQDVFWYEHSRLNGRCLLAYAFMYFYGSHQGQIAERAREHARILQKSFDNRVPAEEILDLLVNNGGLNGVKKAQKAQLPHKEKEPPTKGDSPHEWDDNPDAVDPPRHHHRALKMKFDHQVRPTADDGAFEEDYGSDLVPISLLVSRADLAHFKQMQTSTRIHASLKCHIDDENSDLQFQLMEFYEEN